MRRRSDMFADITAIFAIGYGIERLVAFGAFVLRIVPSLFAVLVFLPCFVGFFTLTGVAITGGNPVIPMNLHPQFYLLLCIVGTILSFIMFCRRLTRFADVLYRQEQRSSQEGGDI